MRASEIVNRFLTSIGRPTEARYYLDLFRSESAERFALIDVSPDLTGDSGALAVDLDLLASLDLIPTVACKSPEEQQRIVAAVSASAAAAELTNAAQLARDGTLPVVVRSDLADLVNLTAELGVAKVVFLTAASGLQPVGKPVRLEIDLHCDYHDLLLLLPPDQAQILADARRLVEATARRLTVAVTSPLDLLRELFTTRGAGTLIRCGARVHRIEKLSELDRDAFHQLLTSSFGREPLPTFYLREPQALYIADDYRGAAVIEERGLCAYLSKFAVDVGARGAGIGGDLWRRLSAEYPRLLWRSRPENPINPWYQSQCDGLIRREHWHIFWRGLQPAEISEAIVVAEEATEDFATD